VWRDFGLEKLSSELVKAMQNSKLVGGILGLELPAIFNGVTVTMEVLIGIENNKGQST
jgi:hypothetical protein